MLADLEAGLVRLSRRQWTVFSAGPSEGTRVTLSSRCTAG